jgi:hypothetical protein
MFIAQGVFDKNMRVIMAIEISFRPGAHFALPCLKNSLARYLAVLGSEEK